ncbi:unnamed protein product, partial [Brenthis ino]
MRTLLKQHYSVRKHETLINTMFPKIVSLCAVVAVASAGLVPAAVHYSSAAAVSSQSIVRHDEPQAIGAKFLAPVAKLAVAAPVYHAAPAHVAYQSAPATYYHAAPVAKVLAQPEEIVSL